MALEPLPGTLVATRDSLHRVAEQIVAPARKPHNEIALTWTPGGFGTPPFEFEGRSLQVMVDGAELVVVEDGAERRAPLTTLAEAARFVGADLFPDGASTEDTPLDMDPEAARGLGELYGFAAAGLARVRDELPAEAAASDINLWPEHFDIAFEAGDESAGQRANYGVSPGDENHDEPYAYVGPWSGAVEGELWNATGFTGAELGYGELVVASEPEAALVDFMLARAEALAAHA
jgi:hypothetical protein